MCTLLPGYHTLPHLLLLAGEHTHTGYPGTVHGAYLSGVDQAKTILKTLTPMPAAPAQAASPGLSSPSPAKTPTTATPQPLAPGLSTPTTPATPAKSPPPQPPGVPATHSFAWRAVPLRPLLAAVAALLTVAIL